MEAKLSHVSSRRGRERRPAFNCTPDAVAEAIAPQEELEEMMQLGKSYVPRENRTPFIQRKIRSIAAGAEPLTLKPAMCRLERCALGADGCLILLSLLLSHIAAPVCTC